MGVPAFFAWLARRYPDIVLAAKEEKVYSDSCSILTTQPCVVNGVALPLDTSTPNPNGKEFDNLYLDLNCIIHPCCHPDGREAPETEEDMFLAVFEYIDRLISLVRPRRYALLKPEFVCVFPCTYVNT